MMIKNQVHWGCKNLQQAQGSPGIARPGVPKHHVGENRRSPSGPGKNPLIVSNLTGEAP